MNKLYIEKQAKILDQISILSQSFRSIVSITGLVNIQHGREIDENSKIEVNELILVNHLSLIFFFFDSLENIKVNNYYNDSLIDLCIVKIDNILDNEKCGYNKDPLIKSKKELQELQELFKEANNIYNTFDN